MRADTKKDKEKISLDSPIYKLMGNNVYMLDISNLVSNSIELSVDMIKKMIASHRNPYQEWYFKDLPPLIADQFDAMFDESPDAYAEVFTPIDMFNGFLHYVRHYGYTPAQETRRSLVWKSTKFIDFLEEINMNADKEGRQIYDENKILVLIDRDCQSSIRDLTGETMKGVEYDIPRYMRIEDIGSYISFEYLKECNTNPKSYTGYKELRDYAIQEYTKYVKNTKH